MIIGGFFVYLYNKYTMKNLFTFLIILFSSIYLFQIDTNFSLISSSKPCLVSKVKIKGLNSYNIEDLKLVESTLENFYKIDCEIVNSITIKSNSLIDCEETQRKLGNIDRYSYNEEDDVIIYVTDSKLKSLNKGVWGVCYGNSIYLRSECMLNKEDAKQALRETAIHEISHLYIYEHCHNECLMNPEAFDQWNESTNTPTFCDDCKSKLP